MKFGPVPPKKLPKQDPFKVLLLAEKWQRAAYAQQRWAEPAKKAWDFFEGRQYTETEIARLNRQRRPHFKFNMIAPLVRLVLGYQRANKTDITFLPGQDMRASEDLAEALTRLEKVIAEGSRMPFVDSMIFLDGLVGGRGYFDTRLNFDSNDLGEVKTEVADPFSVYPDPDASTYDLNETASHMIQSSFVSLDEIEATFGKQALDLLRPFVLGQTPLAPISSMIVTDEISPIRTFGERVDIEDTWWDSFYSLVGDFVDTSRKTIRIIDASFSNINTNLSGVYDFGFGAAKAGSSYPTLYVIGTYSSVFGVWYSTDLGNSFTSLWTGAGTGNPSGSTVPMSFIDGDKNVFPRCYVGLGGGNGYIYFG